jgi:4-hydroxybenzoate polyprenyltransferase
MVYQTAILFSHSEPFGGLIAFVFFSTICSYNFHWYLTSHSLTSSQRIRWAQEHRGWHLILYFAGLAGAAISFFTIIEHWIALAFGAFLTFLYSAPKLPQTFFRSLKRIAIGKTIFLSFVWTYVTTILPIVVAGSAWRIEYSVFVANRFFLIYGICILFDYRDREDDQRDGIRSMITYFSEKGVDFLFILSLVLFIITTLALALYGHSALEITVLLMPGLITAGLYNYAKRNFSDYLYYFVLDGLMGLSGLVILFFKI